MVAVPDRDFGGGRYSRRIQTIVVAHDERHIARLFEVNLQRVGYIVTVCHDGQEALNWMVTAPPDLAILSLLLPGLDGLEVMHRMVKNKATRDVPVIILTKRRDGPGWFDAHLWCGGRCIALSSNLMDLLETIRRLQYV